LSQRHKFDCLKDTHLSHEFVVSKTYICRKDMNLLVLKTYICHKDMNLLVLKTHICRKDINLLVSRTYVRREATTGREIAAPLHSSTNNTAPGHLRKKELFDFLFFLLYCSTIPDASKNTSQHSPRFRPKPSIVVVVEGGRGACGGGAQPTNQKPNQNRTSGERAASDVLLACFWLAVWCCRHSRSQSKEQTDAYTKGLRLTT